MSEPSSAESLPTRLPASLVSALDAVTPERLTPTDALRHGVGEYVDALKGAGWAPEQVLEAVRLAVYPRLEHLFGPADHADQAATVLARVVSWAIARYYQTPPEDARTF